MAVGSALVLVFAGLLVVSTSKQGSVIALVGALLLLVAGLVGVTLGIVWSIRAIRQGRSVAIVPLLLAAFLLFYALVSALGAFSVFYGWDG